MGSDSATSPRHYPCEYDADERSGVEEETAQVTVWKSVESGLPTIRQRYLVTVDLAPAAPIVDVAFFNGTWFTIRYIHGGRDGKITHWDHLPEPTHQTHDLTIKGDYGQDISR